MFSLRSRTQDHSVCACNIKNTQPLSYRGIHNYTQIFPLCALDRFPNLHYSLSARPAAPPLSCLLFFGPEEHLHEFHHQSAAVGRDCQEEKLATCPLPINQWHFSSFPFPCCNNPLQLLAIGARMSRMIMSKRPLAFPLVAERLVDTQVEVGYNRDYMITMRERFLLNCWIDQYYTHKVKGNHYQH